MSENQNNPFRNKSISQDVGHQKEFGENREKFNGGRRGGFGGGSRGRGGGGHRGFNDGGRGRGGRGRGGRGRGGGGRGSGRGGARGHDRTDTNGLTSKEQEWGKVKFNPVSANAIVESATPWKKFKHEIIQKKEEEANISVSAADSAEADDFRKRREKDYRKMLIKDKQKEPTKWEDFTDTFKQTVKQSKQKKEKPAKVLKKGFKPCVSDELLNNFDSKKLTFAQNNHIRKVITKTTILAKGDNLQYVVKDMKSKLLKGKKPY